MRISVHEYRRAMCIVLPSVYRTDEGYETVVPELLGQTLLEGMACGAPAICTDVASMPEIVEHGVSGFVVPPNDPASIGERLVVAPRAHPAEAASMGEAGRRRVLAKFTWTHTVDCCLEAYGSAVSGTCAVASRRHGRRAVTILERVIAAGRPLQVKGKGFLLNPITPHEGSREVTVAGGYRMTVDLRTRFTGRSSWAASRAT